jgi:hypothetical protein
MNWKTWAVVNHQRRDRLGETFRTKQQAMAWAVERVIVANEYHEAGTLSKRWRIAYRRGWRIVRAEVRTGADHG